MPGLAELSGYRWEPSGEIYLYFNARDDWPLSRGRECIGLAIGRPPGVEG
jgi:hypothetical protein